MNILSEKQIELINKPLPKEAIKPHPTKSYLSTIKAIYVTERLNEVFGIGGWSLKTELIKIDPRTTAKGKIEYDSLLKTIFEVSKYNIYYECIAGSSNEDMGDATKGGTTDAITKICSYLGIGMNVFKGLGDSQKEPDKKNVDEENNLAIWDNQIKNIESLIGLEKFWNDNKDAVAGNEKVINLFKIRKATLIEKEGANV